VGEALRRLIQRALTPLLGELANEAAARSIEPDQITWAGFWMALLASGVLLLGHPAAAGVIFLLGCALDMLDGALARQQNKATPYGAFLDSTLDRLGEGAILTAVAYRLSADGHTVAVVGAMLTLVGSFLTSYVRARAEALGIACTEGWVTRPERVVVLGFGLILNLLPETVFLLAAVTLWTAIQRIRHVQVALRVGN
jgi:CDP-diacylglycerol--glycerol-3-phosphate 3-phosphatidyltransferase